MVKAAVRKKIDGWWNDECADPSSLIDKIEAEWAAGGRWVGTAALRGLALEAGLERGDLDAMWRGIRQDARLFWIRRVLNGHDVPDPKRYTQIYEHECFNALATGDKLLFSKWLTLVPRKLDHGHLVTRTISNALTAFGHQDATLLADSASEVSKRRHSSEAGKYDKALLSMLTFGSLDDALRVGLHLKDAVKGWGRGQPRWQTKDPLAIAPLGALVIARTRLSEPVELPKHDTFRDPPPWDAPYEPFIDFSERLPTLARWCETLEDIDPAKWETK